MCEHVAQNPVSNKHCIIWELVRSYIASAQAGPPGGSTKNDLGHIKKFADHSAFFSTIEGAGTLAPKKMQIGSRHMELGDVYVQWPRRAGDHSTAQKRRLHGPAEGPKGRLVVSVDGRKADWQSQRTAAASVFCARLENQGPQYKSARGVHLFGGAFVLRRGQRA